MGKNALIDLLRRPFESPPLPSATIASRRQAIADSLMKASSTLREPDFSTVGKEDLYHLLHGYDEEFLEGGLQQWLEARTGRLQLRWSRRMTSSGGITSRRCRSMGGRRMDELEIAVSATLLFGTDFSQNTRPVRVAGLITVHRLDALQRIFEHELIHLLEMILWRESSCAKPGFRTTAWGLFGHKESNHQLITPAERAQSELSLKVGDAVRFSYREKRLCGYINRIGRRATVLVEDDRGERYDDGRRYLCFYVPLAHLESTKRDSKIPNTCHGLRIVDGPGNTHGIPSTRCLPFRPEAG